jgi:hypothetical protein
MDCRVISADNHINEPPWVFDRVPAALKDRAPTMMRGADGGDGWSFDGGVPKRTFGIEAMAGFEKKDFRLSGLRFDQIRPGNYDGAEHLKDMDIDGVYGSVTYPANVIQVYSMAPADAADRGRNRDLPGRIRPGDEKGRQGPVHPRHAGAAL